MGLIAWIFPGWAARQIHGSPAPTPRPGSTHPARYRKGE
jgi:hypothetical protein